LLIPIILYWTIKECVDIRKSIKECQNSLDNFDKEFLKNLPTCFKDYSNAVDDQRRDLQVINHIFKIIKFNILIIYVHNYILNKCIKI